MRTAILHNARSTQSREYQFDEDKTVKKREKKVRLLRDLNPGARFSKVPKTFRVRKAIRFSWNGYQGPVSRKSRKLFAPEKPFAKLRPAYCVKLVFSYVVKGIKIKITAKFRASRRLPFEDTKRIIMSPEKFLDFRETGP